jgi:hypothetical protein
LGADVPRSKWLNLGKNEGQTWKSSVSESVVGDPNANEVGCGPPRRLEAFVYGTVIMKINWESKFSLTEKKCCEGKLSKEDEAEKYENFCEE